MTPHSPNRTPHKHAELIKAWADGAEIQCKVRGCPDYWRDVINPRWDCSEYRTKPKTVRFRCYLNRCGEIIVVTTGEDPLVWFAKWLGDWQEVEV